MSEQRNETTPESNQSGSSHTRREILRAAAGLSLAGMLGCGGVRSAQTTSAVPGTSPSSAPVLVTVRRSGDRGHANHGWLDSYHTFSFANYHDPDFVQFGDLRVINQDRVTGGRGFPMHGHRDMEIVSYVLDGVMEHKDTMGNGSQMRPGDVQLMSAGKGVQHSEFNASQSDGLHFLQMWVLPAERATEPRYEQRAFSREERGGRLRLVVSPDGADGSLVIGQDARLFASILTPGDSVRHEQGSGRSAWLHVATGAVEVNGVRLSAGDGAALTGAGHAEVRGVADAEFVMWEVAAV